MRGYEVVVGLTLMQPAPTPWAPPCQEQVVELDAIEPIGAPLEREKTYRVLVNDHEMASFTLPGTGIGNALADESPIVSAEVVFPRGESAGYELRVVSGMPQGSSCSQFNGYRIRRGESNVIDVFITHHRVADGSTVCTADYPVVETAVPLGSDFEAGIEYTVRVNSDTFRSFAAS